MHTYLLDWQIIFESTALMVSSAGTVGSAAAVDIDAHETMSDGFLFIIGRNGFDNGLNAYVLPSVLLLPLLPYPLVVECDENDDGE